MTYRLRFLPEVEEDVISGYLGYEEKAPGLGEEFLRMFHACVEKVRRHPSAALELSNDFSRSLLRRFPYAVYFKAVRKEIVVFGVFHCARDPGLLRSELLDRNQQ
jgi:hypothetical protein